VHSGCNHVRSLEIESLVELTAFLHVYVFFGFCLCVLAFMAPMPLSSRMMLRTASSGKSLPAARIYRTAQVSALKMQEVSMRAHFLCERRLQCVSERRFINRDTIINRDTTSRSG